MVAIAHLFKRGIIKQLLKTKCGKQKYPYSLKKFFSSPETSEHTELVKRPRAEV